MMRLILIGMVSICLTDVLACNPSATILGSVHRVAQPIWNELINIKTILQELKQQGSCEDTTVAGCPVCGVNEVCNQTTFQCMIGCDQEIDLVSEIGDDKITATSSRNYNNKPSNGRLGVEKYWTPRRKATDEYLQFEFQDLKVVTAMRTQYDQVPRSSHVKEYQVETSDNCVSYNTMVPTFVTGDNPDVTSKFPEPVLARCVRVHALDWLYSIKMNIGLYGCKADSI